MKSPVLLLVVSPSAGVEGGVVVGEDFEPDSQPEGQPGSDGPRSGEPRVGSEDVSESAFGPVADRARESARSRGAARTAPDSEVVPEIAPWPVRARRALTAERIVEACEDEPGSEQARHVLAIHDNMRERTLLYAREQELLTSFLTRDPDADGCIDAADITALKVATGLRVSLHRAECLVRDAHRCVALMPGTFAALCTADLPEDFHQLLLRKVRSLPDGQTRVVDEHVAGWDLASISRDQFARHLNSLITLVTAGTIPVAPESERRVDLEVSDPQRGIATLTVTGPTLELKALAHRLDAAARAVQKAQRHALDGEEGPIPFDIDASLRERGRAMSLAVLRYAVITHSMLDIDPVPEPASAYKMLVTVPAMTLLGDSRAPGTIDGVVPIPAEQARALAASQPTWQRILTDPVSGAYLPVTAETYTPSAQMRLQLRLRHPVCAAPGCTRATVLAAEDDHIEEFDHEDPENGGPTSLFNLHRLCWLHHKIKTEGLIDPERDHPDTEPDPEPVERATFGEPLPHPPAKAPPLPRPPRRPTGEPTITRWTIDGELRTATRDDHDLLTPVLAAVLDKAWATHLRARDDAVRLAEREAARPARDRVMEQRRHEYQRLAARRAPRTRRTRRTGPPPPSTYDPDDPPPF